MFELIESPPTVLAFRTVGQITKSDYDTVLDPAVEQMATQHGELRVVIVIGDDFERMTAGGSWEDMKFGLAHWTKWKRCAVVTDKSWVESATKLFGWMLPGDVKIFDEDDVTDAIEWAAA